MRPWSSTLGVHSNISKAEIGRRLLPCRVHHVQRVHRTGPLRPAAAADVAFRQRRIGQRRGGRSARALDRLAAARGAEHDLAVGQVAAVEIVVLAEGQLTQARAVDVHLEQVVERILRQPRLVELVRPLAQARIVAAPGKQHLLAVVRDVGTQDVARREALGQALQLRLVGLEILQHVQPAARLRPPAQILVRHVRPLARCTAHEHQIVEVQQRIGQRQSRTAQRARRYSSRRCGSGSVGRQLLGGPLDLLEHGVDLVGIQAAIACRSATSSRRLARQSLQTRGQTQSLLDNVRRRVLLPRAVLLRVDHSQTLLCVAGLPSATFSLAPAT